MCVYIYIYIYTHICEHVVVYVFAQQPVSVSVANPPRQVDR